ncbi:trimethylamine:corrinoid methyltransferase-like protein [Kitasatospora herbaricolor]|uniref:hypothetical protein n=1 Tax=Kitasatospora herbaricolor TaxID=68217 RepID=UPI00174C08B1|nr:hypothetical protein [Kitasatospora herbaricolor]MDQ0308331.1 trimethylamine:corrinoid methyltransferase-like protein [Kitasatospora herbaricolor]
MPYLLAFALTLLVEVPLYVGALALGGAGRARAAAAAVAVNCATHPPLWWFLGRFTGATAAEYWTAVALAELAVVAVEAALVGRLAGCRGPLPHAASLTANAASVLAGMLVARGLAAG